MPTPNDNRTPGQLRAAELKAEAARADRRRRSILIVSVLVAAAILVAFFVSLALKKKATSAPLVAFAAPAAADVPGLVSGAGLTMLPNEGGTKFHIHSHLQVSDNGQDVVVPAEIGVQPGVALSPLHTHDASGAVHVESPVTADFTLGEFFKEWAVPLTPTCVSTKCADATHELKVWVNGTPFTGDPNTITLADKQDITVAYLDKGKSFTPEKFDFAAAKL